MAEADAAPPAAEKKPSRIRDITKKQTGVAKKKFVHFFDNTPVPKETNDGPPPHSWRNTFITFLTFLIFLYCFAIEIWSIQLYVSLLLLAVIADQFDLLSNIRAANDPKADNDTFSQVPAITGEITSTITQHSGSSTWVQTITSTTEPSSTITSSATATTSPASKKQGEKNKDEDKDNVNEEEGNQDSSSSSSSTSTSNKSDAKATASAIADCGSADCDDPKNLVPWRRSLAKADMEQVLTHSFEARALKAGPTANLTAKCLYYAGSTVPKQYVRNYAHDYRLMLGGKAAHSRLPLT